MLHHSTTQWPECKVPIIFVPTEHTGIASTNFGKMHINPFTAFRSSKVSFAIKTLNAKLGQNGQTLGALSHP